MGRLMSIDYGRKRCGIAVTDILRIVANGLTTVPTAQLNSFVLNYVSREPVDAIVVGHPRTLRGADSESMRFIKPGIASLRKVLPASIPIVFFDERFTSAIAHRTMLDGGLRKMDRRDKALVDEISASIILNDYLASLEHNNSTLSL
ncbi:MAG: Holliday junction resolvase RuvX [Muribaculaceae bacterium]|jgi:RNAse H domain protein, YqgF family|nr:Holliday junction resolvase RuvX [Muribaculaceae bacterium]